MNLMQEELLLKKKYQSEILLITLVFIVWILISGCSSTRTPTASPKPINSTSAATITAPTANLEKIVTIALTQEPNSLNRSYSGSWSTSFLTNIYGCWPWIYDEANVVHPFLLTEMPTVSEDGLVVTMKLRDDIKWSDNTPITAEDFIFTQAMIINPANTVPSIFPYDLFKITAPDPQTVVMTFNQVFVPWLSNLWSGTLMPKHILQPVYESTGSIDAADWNKAPTVGCGPFNFTKWESGNSLRFDRNPYYWGPEPKLDAVIFLFVTDDASQTNACLDGQVDICYRPMFEDMQPFVDEGLNILRVPSGYNEGWFFNFRENASPGIKDLNVRRAIAMGLDRQANTSLRMGLVNVNETFWDALPSYVDPSILPYKYDPEAARTLLETNGYVDINLDGIREDKNGNPLTITLGFLETPRRQEYQIFAQQQMKAIGIDLQTSSYDSDTLFAGFAEGGPAAVGTLDIMQWSDLPTFPDPATTYWLCDQLQSESNPYGFNYFGCDQTLDILLMQQVVTTDLDARKQIFWQISKYMHDYVLYLGIWEDGDIWIVNPRVTGVKFSGVTPFFNIGEWDVTN